MWSRRFQWRGKPFSGWGNLSDEEKKRFCTSQDNIKHRLEEFSLSDLPKTFQDAVKVTRQLRIPYLWIDSLCIIQSGDNNEDWQRESRRMETVFSAAYCTVAATSAADWTTGFLERTVTTESIYVQSAAGKQLYVSTDIDDFDGDVGGAELNRRAWVMQESVLSRRTIHFSAKQTYFECGEGVYCENLTKLKSNYFTLDPNFPNRLLESGHRPIIEFIRFLIEDFSKRELTYKTDRCAALSGLQARVAHAIKCKGRYGTFEKYLHRNLLWHASDVDLQKIKYETMHVPSWSWMVYDGGIRFRDEDVIPFRHHCEHALIADVGRFQDCRMELDGSRYAVFDLSKTNRGWICYDVQDGKNLLEEHCFVMGFTKNSEHYYILVARPTSVDGEYERVGIGQVHKNCLVRERVNVRVV
ncbi:heterokaryon incompatibility protein-domain-containing protein [Cadophora sp. MPI-SDFR-AT-0126]|nr:heterokaryon incompatibility protein-domain-containing protein [Leotiomycetes sp. MPI-SDFR-AT-0126]